MVDIKKVLLATILSILVPVFGFAHGKGDVEEISVENMNSWQESFDLESRKPGKYNIMITARDLGGNVHVEGPHNIYLDPKSDLPICGITNPYPNMRVVGNLNIVGTCVAGYEVAVLGVVLQIILDIGGQPELGFHLQSFAVGLAALVEIGAGGIVDIENAVVALVGLQLALYTTQFAADDDETLIDEVGGIDSHLVLVADSILIISSDEHVEHILGT